MVDVTVICVGQLKEKFYQEAAAEYVKRLSRYCKLNMVELAEQKLPKNPSLGEIQLALEKEGDAIRGKIPPGSGVVALAIEGKQRSSEELAEMIAAWSHSAATLEFGGIFPRMASPSFSSADWISPSDGFLGSFCSASSTTLSLQYPPNRLTYSAAASW